MLMLAFGVFLVPSARYPVGQLNLDGYGAYGWTGGALMVVAALIAALTTHKRIARLDSAPPVHLPLGQTIGKIGRTLANQAFLILLATTLFNYVNLGMTYSATTYIMTYYWEMPQAGFMAYSASLFVGVIGAFLLIGFLQSRIEKRVGAVACMLVSLAFGLSPYLLRFAGWFPENNQPLLIPLLFTLITISNGMAVAGGMLTQSMGADIIEASQERTGERTEGLFFSAYFFTQKCATGIGIFVAGTIISASGFPAKARPGEVPQAVLDQFAIYFVIAAAVISISAITVISRFPITRADHQRRIANLAGSGPGPGGTT